MPSGTRGADCSATARNSSGSASSMYLSKYTSETCPDRSTKWPLRLHVSFRRLANSLRSMEAITLLSQGCRGPETAS